MSLTFNLRHLAEKNLHLRGELPVEDLDLMLQHELVQGKGALEYDLELQKLDHNVLVQGKLHMRFTGRCARCLEPFERELEIEPWTVLLPLAGEDAVPVVNDCVDLTPHMREDILLALPQHPLCKPECGGMDRPPSEDSKDPGWKTEEPSSAWAVLDKLKFD